MSKKLQKRQLLLFQGSERECEPLDITSLSVFQRCPFEYKYRYLPRNPYFDPKGPEILLGRYLHSITKGFLSVAANRRQESFDIQTNREMLLGKFRSRNERYEEAAAKAISYLKEGPLCGVSVRAMEYVFKKRVKKFLLIGRIDFVGREGKGDILVDFKLDSAELEHHVSESSKYLQLIFYYFGIRDSISLNSANLAYYFYANGRLETTRVSDELLHTGWEEIERLNEARKKESLFPARKSYYCLTCGVRNRDLCPLWTYNRNR